MVDSAIRPAFRSWPKYNSLIREAVRGLSAEQLAFQPSPERWPFWASVGHMACQRVSGLCGLVGERGAESTPFPNALFNCPGDEDLDHVLTADDLVHALDSTFAIIERCLDTWAIDTLDNEIRRSFGAEEIVFTRGSILQRTLAHDLTHIAEVNEILRLLELPGIALWD